MVLCLVPLVWPVKIYWLVGRRLTAAVTLGSTEESSHPRVTWVNLELVVLWSLGCPLSSTFPIRLGSDSGLSKARLRQQVGVARTCEVLGWLQAGLLCHPVLFFLCSRGSLLELGLPGGWWESSLVSEGSRVLGAVAFSALLRGVSGGVSVGSVAGALIVPCHHAVRGNGWWWELYCSPSLGHRPFLVKASGG